MSGQYRITPGTTKLTATNHKLSMALDVANIIPWKWDLLSKTILCDINKPIELSSPGNSVNDEQLAVPDTQYFKDIQRRPQTGGTGIQRPD